MGGKIFEGTRPVTERDVEEVISSLYDFKKTYSAKTEIIGSWNNRRARGVSEMGDLDLLVHYQPYGLWGDNLRNQPDPESLAHRMFDDIETKSDGPTSVFIKRRDIQIDVHFVTDDRLFHWIKKATTVPYTDTYKPLYRNEVLFQLARYYTVDDVVLRMDGSPESYTRDRYTLWDGVINSTYTFSAKAKTPTKTADRSTTTSFDRFLIEDLHLDQWTVENPTFMNVLSDAFKDTTKTKRLHEDLVKAFTKKGVDIPDILK